MILSHGCRPMANPLTSRIRDRQLNRETPRLRAWLTVPSPSRPEEVTP